MCWEAAGHAAIESTAAATQIHGAETAPEPRLAADGDYVLRTGHEFICLDIPAILELGRTDMAFVRGAGNDGQEMLDSVLDWSTHDPWVNSSGPVDRYSEVVGIAIRGSPRNVVLLS